MVSRDPAVAALADAVGAELASGIFAAQSQPGQLTRIAACDEAEAARRAALGRGWLAQADAIAPDHLDADDALDLAIARVTAERLARQEAWYWHVHDPLGMGFFGRFAPTAYAGGWHLSVIGGEMQRQRFDTRADLERYRALVEDCVAVVVAMAARLQGQRARGDRLPPAQARKARALVKASAERLSGQLRVAPSRLAALAGTGDFEAGLARTIDGALHDAFAALAAAVEEASGEPKPAGEGEVRAIYEALVQHYTSLPLDAEAVHARGLEKMAALGEAMAALRAEAGFAGDDHAFARALAADPVYRADSVEQISARFADKLAQARAYRASWFHRVPRTACAAAPLPEALEGSMTFGYYQIGQPDGDPSRYLFNTRSLQAMGLARVAAFAFHELEPGHHIHLAGQAEDAGLPPLRRFNSFNAFNEGWAEYAAALAGEYGLYATPGERFGRLLLEAMLTSRLVVDTGLNAQRWSIERATGYLIERGFLPPAEAESEALRYAYDLPGQALAYKLGDEFIAGERARMAAALGDRFDLRDFHALVLEPGARPLPLIAAAVDRAIAA